MSVTPVGPLAYEGDVTVPYIVRNSAPTTSNNKFLVPTVWINPDSGIAYILVSKALGIANWVTMASTSGGVVSFLTPDANTVTPTAGVITIANGTAMDITGSGSTITFNSMGGGIAWVSVAGTTQTLSAGHGYVTTNGAQTVFSLPVTASFGDFYIIAGVGAGGWSLSQNAGQSVKLGNLTTTIGVGGSLTSTFASDTIQIVCTTANTTFKVIDSMGNITVV